MSEHNTVAAVLREHGSSVYIPTVLFAIGEGSLVPLLPAAAIEMEATIATAALVASMLVVGQVLGSLPAGWLVSILGEKWTLASGALTACFGTGSLLVAAGLPGLIFGAILVGSASSVFALARHALLASSVPYSVRGRALSLLGGAFRIGSFLGPLLGAIALSAFASNEAVFLVALVAMVMSLVLIVISPRSPSDSRRSQARDVPAVGMLKSLLIHRKVLFTVGLGTAAVSALRAVRLVLIPLWGTALGLDTSVVSLIFGLGGAFEVGLFYFGGQVMDRFGRRWAAIPSVTIMTLALLAIAASDIVSFSFAWYTMCVVLSSLGNGLSSGLLLTLSADQAPAENTMRFLSSWRLLANTGAASLPVAVSIAIGVFGLVAGTIFAGTFGFLGLWLLWRWIPTSRVTPRTS